MANISANSKWIGSLPRKGQASHGDVLGLLARLIGLLTVLKFGRRVTLTLDDNERGLEQYTLSWDISELHYVTRKRKTGSPKPPISPSPKSHHPKTTASRGKKRGD